MSHIPSISVQNPLSATEFLQSLHFTNGAQIEPLYAEGFFSMQLANGKKMYFFGLEFRSSEPNLPLALTEAIEKAADSGEQIDTSNLPWPIAPLVLILDDKVTVLELNLDTHCEPLFSRKFIRDSQGHLIWPSIDALIPVATPRGYGIFLSLRDGERVFASGIVRGCLTDAFDKHPL